MIITIDGPAGSGKSTAARKLAARLGVPYLDTGAMYRVVTLAALRDGVELSADTALARIAASDDWHLDLGPTHIRVTLRGEDVTEEIRSMWVNDHTRYIAGSPAVRKVLVEKQRDIGRRLGSMVTEGRDQGSVAFPDADVKFYMDAAIEKRAERRFHELLAEGEETTLDDVLRNLAERDKTDSERAVAPLRRPAGAVDVDSTQLSIHDVIEHMVDYVEKTSLLPAGDAGAGHVP